MTNETNVLPTSTHKTTTERIHQILDLADPNRPTGFWRKQRATIAMHALLIEDRIDEICRVWGGEAEMLEAIHLGLTNEYERARYFELRDQSQYSGKVEFDNHEPDEI